MMHPWEGEQPESWKSALIVVLGAFLGGTLACYFLARLLFVYSERLSRIGIPF